MFNEQKEVKYFFSRIIATISLIFVAFYYIKNNYIYNMTSSIPKGFYKIEKIEYNQDDIKVGDIIVFNISLADKNFMINRGYISKRTKALIKKVIAKEGDYIEIKNDLKINGNFIKKLPKYDYLGRKLPRQEGEYLLEEGEYFMIGENERSFDSCYLGIINDSQFLFKAQPILITEHH